MVFVTVVMACCANAQSAILRLFLAMRILRVLTAIPKPFSNCCWKPSEMVVCTAGLKRLKIELVELRVLFQETNKLVPLWKPCEYWKLYCELWENKPGGVVREDVPVPVPEVSGLFTGV